MTGDDVCGCCEINDYDPAPDQPVFPCPHCGAPMTRDGQHNPPVPGSCLNCDHSPEEHQPPASPSAATLAYGATGCT